MRLLTLKTIKSSGILPVHLLCIVLIVTSIHGEFADQGQRVDPADGLVPSTEENQKTTNNDRTTNGNDLTGTQGTSNNDVPKSDSRGNVEQNGNTEQKGNTEQSGNSEHSEISGTTKSSSAFSNFAQYMKNSRFSKMQKEQGNQESTTPGEKSNSPLDNGGPGEQPKNQVNPEQNGNIEQNENIEPNKDMEQSENPGTPNKSPSAFSKVGEYWRNSRFSKMQKQQGYQEDTTSGRNNNKFEDTKSPGENGGNGNDLVGSTGQNKDEQGDGTMEGINNVNQITDKGGEGETRQMDGQDDGKGTYPQNKNPNDGELSNDLPNKIGSDGNSMSPIELEGNKEELAVNKEGLPGNNENFAENANHITEDRDESESTTPCPSQTMADGQLESTNSIHEDGNNGSPGEGKRRRRKNRRNKLRNDRNSGQNEMGDGEPQNTNLEEHESNNNLQNNELQSDGNTVSLSGQIGNAAQESLAENTVLEETALSTNLAADGETQQTNIQMSALGDSAIDRMDSNPNDSNGNWKTNKKNKDEAFKFEKPMNDARIFCTFTNNIHDTFRKVKKYFVGELCHAIVFGTPLIIHKSGIFLNKEKEPHLNQIHTYKENALLIVIMKHHTYEEWSMALDRKEKEVELIIKYVKKYHIDGIQFSNLQPTAQDQLDTDMLCKIIIFFKMLIQAAEKTLKRPLKIGVTISSYSQSISSSFESFEMLNELVSWYSIHTISMVKCTPEHIAGTSPLRGEVSLEETIKELIKTNIQKSKIVIGIQLYPHQLGDLKPSTYTRMCSNHKNSWNKWCAARPEHFRLKGEFLRNLDIMGVQLYYMESDDYKAMCKCYAFPMIRALLRGLANKGPSEVCPYLGEAINQPSTCSYKHLITDMQMHEE